MLQSTANIGVEEESHESVKNDDITLITVMNEVTSMGTQMQRSLHSVKAVIQKDIVEIRRCYESKSRRTSVLEQVVALSLALSYATAARFVSFEDRNTLRIFSYIYKCAHFFSQRMHIYMSAVRKSRTRDAKSASIKTIIIFFHLI